MIDGAKSKQIAYSYISSNENINILNKKEKESIGFNTDLEIWEIDTEIFFGRKRISIVLHVIFTTQFPLELPMVFVSPDTFEKIKYIPHIDNNRLVCTYDSELVSTNPEEPAGIVIECIRKSKSIILDGLTGINHSDFNDEFKAYWEEKYGKEKYLPLNILSLINRVQSEDCIKLICLKREISNYNYVLHASDEVSTRFKNFLKEYGIEYNEVDVFYFDGFQQSAPPFDLKNRDILNLVKLRGNDFFEKFKAFINNRDFPKLVICEKHFDDISYLFGWFHNQINTNRNGFRHGKLKQFRVFSSFQSNDNANRITTDVFTKERLENRTSGKKVQEDEKSFLIAGVGSIGSNLIYFLNSINSPEFRFIDADKIHLENIQRHFLGFNYIDSYKTKALKDYILKNNPLQKVQTREDSIVDIVKDDVDYLNEVDYIFISIGKANIDNWICQAIKEGAILKPVFIIWVEPYLCGGHCVYIHPSNPEYEKYFEDDFFRFNVIDSVEYKYGDKKFSLREAGCQSTYVPYSGTNVISFISSLFPYISSIIDFNKKESVAISWLGNLDVVTEMGIKISDYYSNRNAGTMIEHKI